MNITIRFSGNSLNINAADKTVGDVLSDPNFAAVLGFDGSNVEGYIDGVQQGSGSPLAEGDTLVIQQKAHSKAA